MKQYELAKKRLSQGHELTALMEEAYKQIHEHKRILVCPTIASLMVAVFICGIFSPGHPIFSAGLESQGISCMRCHLSDPAAIHIFFRHIFLRGSCFLAFYTALRGRRGTWRIHDRFAWQVRHLATPTVVSRGRRGTWRHPPSFHVAGVALGDIHHRFTWQARHLARSTVVSRGKPGAWNHQLSFRVAGVALGDIHHRFAWQVRHLAAPTVVSRGRRGTWRDPPSFRVAGVALGTTHRRFAWQVWHLATSTIVSHGRRGTWRHPPLFRAWQVWHLATSTIVSRGRRGTSSYLRGWFINPGSTFHVAGVALLEPGWLMVALSHPGRIKIDELPSGYTMAMHKIQTVGAGICSRCRFMSGCLACDPHKCTSYWMRRESARLGRPIDDEYKKSWGSISCSWAKRPWDSRHEPCSKKNWLHQQDH